MESYQKQNLNLNVVERWLRDFSQLELAVRNNINDNSDWFTSEKD